MSSRWDGYVAKLAAKMGLSEWEVIIDDTPAPDGALACVNCTDGRRVAIVRLSPTFDRLPIDEQRGVLVHELLHLHEEVSGQVVWRVKELLPEATFMLLWEMFVLEREYMVDSLAKVLAPTMPAVPKELWA